MKNQLAIGMFDSGVGGLTVLRALKNQLPNEKIVYFGDTARQFYGEKSPETILRYSIENATFLVEQSIKLLAIPCSTASAVSLETLKEMLSIPVIGMIEPGAEKALSDSKKNRIAILATRRTIQSGAYQNHIKKLSPEAFVLPIECPLLAPLVEEGMDNHPATRLILKEYLKPLEHQPVDTILLGCTHYPLLKPLIQEIVGEKVAIIDSAHACAERIEKVLKINDHLNKDNNKASIQYYVSDNPEKFKNLGEKFLNQPLNDVFLKKIWEII